MFAVPVRVAGFSGFFWRRSRSVFLFLKDSSPLRCATGGYKGGWYPHIMDANDLTPEQLAELVRKVQDALLKQARQNRIHISLKSPQEKAIRRDDCELTCCGRDMEYKEFFGVRRYTCWYRPGSSNHPVYYVRQSDGEMLREQDL